MTKLLVGSLFSLGLCLGFANAKEQPRTPRGDEQQMQMSIPEPQPMSCTASGHACSSKDECCSRMCTKGKCG
jgi:hypothetical protein